MTTKLALRSHVNPGLPRRGGDCRSGLFYSSREGLDNSRSRFAR